MKSDTSAVKRGPGRPVALVPMIRTNIYWPLSARAAARRLAAARVDSNVSNVLVELVLRE